MSYNIINIVDERWSSRKYSKNTRKCTFYPCKMCCKVVLCCLPRLPFPAGRPPWQGGCGSNRPLGVDHRILCHTGRLLLSGAHWPDPEDLQLNPHNSFAQSFVYHPHFAQKHTCSFINPPFCTEVCAARCAVEASKIGMWTCLTTGKMLRMSSGLMGALFWLSRK